MVHSYVFHSYIIFHIGTDEGTKLGIRYVRGLETTLDAMDELKVLIYDGLDLG